MALRSSSLRFEVDIRDTSIRTVPRLAEPKKRSIQRVGILGLASCLRTNAYSQQPSTRILAFFLSADIRDASIRTVALTPLPRHRLSFHLAPYLPSLPAHYR